MVCLGLEQVVLSSSCLAAVHTEKAGSVHPRFFVFGERFGGLSSCLAVRTLQKDLTQLVDDMFFEGPSNGGSICVVRSSSYLAAGQSVLDRAARCMFFDVVNLRDVFLGNGRWKARSARSSSFLEPTVVNKVGYWHVLPTISPKATANNMSRRHHTSSPFFLGQQRGWTVATGLLKVFLCATRLVKVLALSIFAPGTLFFRQWEEVEPHNTVLCAHPLLEHMDVVVMLDNEAMCDSSRRNWGIEPSSCTNLNRLLVHIISSLTSLDVEL